MLENLDRLANDAMSLVSNDDTEWAERGDYWLQQLNAGPKIRGRKPRFIHRPLILTGHGVKLRIDRGSLLIRNGFTHYPQEADEYRFFPRDGRLPSRIIILDGDGGVTFDALEWLSAQGIPLIQLNWRGEVINVAGNLGYGGDPELIRAQLNIQNSSHSMEFSNWLIQAKIEKSMDTIKKIFAPSPITENALRRIRAKLAEIQQTPPSSINILLGAEGAVANAYFRCWHAHPLQWKATGRRPIPDSWNHIGARLTTNLSNRHARHPMNAMLNYAYGVLESQIRIHIAAMGFDPTIGYMHAAKENRHSMALDLMEPSRPLIDRQILAFIQNHTLSPYDFILDKIGVCKLHPQFARNIVKSVQDMPEIESLTMAAINKLMVPYSSAARRARRNIAAYKARLIGKREYIRAEA